MARRAVSRMVHAEPDTGMAALWRMLSRRARKRGMVWWYLGLTALCAVGIGYLGSYPYTAAVLLMVMNCGWGATAMTLWQEAKIRNGHIDLLLLPVSSAEWCALFDRFFLLGFAVTVAQFGVYVGALAWFEWPVLESFLGLGRGPGVVSRRLVFHGLVVGLMVGFFWAGYWASFWRGWPLAFAAMMPLAVLGMGVLSIRRLVDMRLAMGGTAVAMILAGFLFRRMVRRSWRQRSAEILL